MYPPSPCTSMIGAARRHKQAAAAEEIPGPGTTHTSHGVAGAGHLVHSSWGRWGAGRLSPPLGASGLPGWPRAHLSPWCRRSPPNLAPGPLDGSRRGSSRKLAEGGDEISATLAPWPTHWLPGVGWKGQTSVYPPAALPCRGKHPHATKPVPLPGGSAGSLPECYLT